MKTKFVQSIETQKSGTMAPLTIKNFGPRSYFKLDLSKTCEVILSLHQEDEDEMGIAKTRPNTDLGFVILQKKDNLLKLIKYVEPKIQREIYYHSLLNQGEYYVVPKCYGRNVRGIRDFSNESQYQTEAQNYKDQIFTSKFVLSKKNERQTTLMQTDFSPESPFIISIIEDIFRKQDINNDGYISDKEILKIKHLLKHSHFGKNFDEIVKHFEPARLDGSPPKGLSLQGFKKFFNNFLKKTDDQHKIQAIFKKLGYDNQLFSFKSRVVTFGVNSLATVNVKTCDALKGSNHFPFIKLI